MSAVYKKEMRAYFTSMAGYMFIAIFVFLTALLFYLFCLSPQSGDYTAVFTGSPLLFIILIPMLTMRLFAEEAKQKTDQMLYTAPVKVSAIVAAKFLSAVTMFVIAIGLTALFPYLLSRFGSVPARQILGAYAGYILLGVCYISVGLFISVLTENQIVAAVVTFSAIFILNTIDFLYSGIPASRPMSLGFVIAVAVALAIFLYLGTKSLLAAGVTCGVISAAAVVVYIIKSSLFDGLIVKTLGWLSIQTRFAYFIKGIFNIADVVYYLSFAFVFVFLTMNVIERRRWS